MRQYNLQEALTKMAERIKDTEPVGQDLKTECINSNWDGDFTSEYAPEVLGIYYDNSNDMKDDDNPKKIYKLTEDFTFTYVSGGTSTWDFDTWNLISIWNGEEIGMEENITGTEEELIRKVFSESDSDTIASTIQSAETSQYISKVNVLEEGKLYEIISSDALSIAQEFIIATDTVSHTFTYSNSGEITFAKGIYGLTSSMTTPVKIVLDKPLDYKYTPTKVKSDINNLDLRVISLEVMTLRLELTEEDEANLWTSLLSGSGKTTCRFYKKGTTTPVKYTELVAAFANKNRITLKTSTGENELMYSRSGSSNGGNITVSWIQAAADEPDTTSNEGNLICFSCTLYKNDETESTAIPNDLWASNIITTYTELYGGSSDTYTTSALSSIKAQVANKRLITWKGNVITNSSYTTDTDGNLSSITLKYVSSVGFVTIVLTQNVSNKYRSDYTTSVQKITDSCDQAAVGTYVYQCVVADDGTKTYSWVAQS